VKGNSTRSRTRVPEKTTYSRVLHSSGVDKILKWTQEDLDAYLASADIIIAQDDEVTG
jgi:cytochrome c2